MSEQELYNHQMAVYGDSELLTEEQREVIRKAKRQAEVDKYVKEYEARIEREKKNIIVKKEEYKKDYSIVTAKNDDWSNQRFNYYGI